VNGITTTRTYDGFGRQRSESTPQHGDVTFDYLARVAPAAQTSAAVVTIYDAQAPAYTVQRNELGAGQTLLTYNQKGYEVLRQWKGGDGQFV
jgi:hypothetical protein